MAPRRVKTYSRSNRSTVNNYVNPFNELLAENTTKRLAGRNQKKHTLSIKELPPRPRRGTLLVDDSLEISTEDTFDKLLRKNRSAEARDGDDQKKKKTLNNSFTEMNTFHSPIMTRKRKKSDSISKITHNEKPISAMGTDSSNPYQDRLNASTIDGIDVSLEIEAVQGKSEKSSSYLMIAAKYQEESIRVSLSNIFTRTFHEKHDIQYSSTPVMASQQPPMKIYKNTISPIKNSNGFSKSEHCGKNNGISSGSSQNLPGTSDNLMSFITLRRKNIPKVERDKVDVSQNRRLSLTNDGIVNTDSSNISGVENNSSISRIINNIIEQSSYILPEKKGAPRVLEESYFSGEICVDTKSTIASDGITSFDTFSNSSISKKMKAMQNGELVSSSNLLSRRLKRLSDSHSMLHTPTNAKRSKSIGDSSANGISIDVDSESEQISYDTGSVHLGLFDVENLYPKQNIFRDVTNHIIPSSASIFSTVHDRKELMVNLSRKDIITYTDFENSHLRNISMGGAHCDEEFNSHQNIRDIVVNLSRRVCTQTVDETKARKLIVNVTQNILDDYSSPECYTDDYSAVGSSSLLSNNVSSHKNTSIIESSHAKTQKKNDSIISYLQHTHKFPTESTQEAEKKMYLSTMGHKEITYKVDEISFIDLTDSLNESAMPKLPQIYESNQRLPTPESPDIIESSILESSQIYNDSFEVPIVMYKKKNPPKAVLKGGKSWRRSLSNFRISSLLGSMITENKILETEAPCGSSESIPKNKRPSIRIIPVKASTRSRRNTTLLEDYAVNTINSYVPDQILEGNLENSLRCLSLRTRTTPIRDSLPVTAREVVLRRCGQTEPIRFSECYPESALQHCQKIGEGVFGEVFLYRNPVGGTSVMKVIPIEGVQIVNGERQKKFEEILSEVVIAMELSNLRNDKKNATSAFSLVQKIRCVQGHYPEKLLDLWELFEETQGSENDCPDLFVDDQLYIVLELENAGKDLEAYVFLNSQQAYSMFKQVAFGLAVAEEQLRFEHRDLHWGNILLNTVDKSHYVEFCLDGETYSFPSKGVVATIIDFTLSRIESDGVVIFNDLGLDPDLFVAEGDYQFEIYKLMQKKNRNNWQGFEPYSNLLWLHYILDKAITALRYKNTGSKIHKDGLMKLTKIRKEILSYKSVKDLVLNASL